MMGTLSFTLYEVWGYLLPGGMTLLAFVVLYWSCFVPGVPLGIPNFRAGSLTWIAVIMASYVLGHAVQAVGNVFFREVEISVLNSHKGRAPTWIRERARQAASEILKVVPDQLEPRWIFRTLDEYALQIGNVGDRDIFVYREGFYRGTALSLFILSVALLVRMFVPGASILFTKGLFYLSFWELLTTVLLVASVGYLFVRRYQRFAEYRVTRAILAALVVQGAPARRLPSESADKRKS